MSMRLYRSLQEHLWDRVPVGLFRVTAELNGRFVSANAYVCQFLGHGSFAELVEHELQEIMVDESAHRAAFDVLLDTGRLMRQELQVRRKDGSREWISVTAELLRDSAGAPLYVDGVFFDVSAHHRTIVELQRSRAIFESLGHLADLGLFLCDPAGVPTFSNAACEEIFGYGLETDRDHTIWRNCAHPEDRDRVLAMWQHAVDTRSSSDFVYRFTPPALAQRLLRVRLAPFFRDDGAVEGWVGTAELIPGLGVP